MKKRRKKPRYINATEAALDLERSMSSQRMQFLCAQGRVAGAKKVGRQWFIPLPVTIRKGRKGGRPPIRPQTKAASGRPGIRSS